MLPAFADLIRLTADGPVPLIYSDAHPDHRGLRMKSHPLPVSINEEEYRYLYDFIVRYKLRCGFDLATGTGVAALAMGCAMKETGGKAWSYDTYEEERTQQQPLGGTTHDFQIGAKGMALARFLISHFDLPVYFSASSNASGISCLESCRGKLLDVVMLDCPKCDADLRRDLLAIQPHLAPEFAVFIHDTHMMPGAASIVESVLGLEMLNVLPAQKFPFVLATNIPNVFKESTP